MNHTEKFFDYYKNNLIYPDAMPNKAHIALAQMEKEGKLIGVVTQNIDGLHQKAGAEKGSTNCMDRYSGTTAWIAVNSMMWTT